MLDLSRIDFAKNNSEDFQKKFRLVFEYEQDLQEICDFVIGYANEKLHNKYKLLQVNSDINKEIQSLINDYCKNYEDKSSYTESLAK